MPRRSTLDLHAMYARLGGGCPLLVPAPPINTTISPHAPPCGLIVLLLEWASPRGPYALHDLPVMFKEVLGPAS